MKKRLAFILFCGFTASSSMYAQCWNQLSGLYGLKNDGTIWNFAAGDTVQIGTDTDWMAVSAGYDHILALKTNGTLWGWGSGSNGQLGLGMLNVGSDFFPEPVAIGTDSNWVQIAAGTSFSMALKDNGIVHTTGSGSYGKLGNGTYFNEYYFNPINNLGSDNAYISAGGNASFVLKTNGSIWYTGSRYYFDENGSNFAMTFEQVGTDTNWTSISAGYAHFFALKSDSTLWATGYNGNGEIGDGTFGYSNGLAQIGSTKWRHVVAGDFNSRGIKADGTLWMWGNSGNNMYSNPVQIGESSSWTDCSVDMATQTFGLYLINLPYELELDNCGIHLGVEEPDVAVMTLYPNPATSLVTLNGFEQGTTVTLADHSGKVLRQFTTDTPDCTFDVTTLNQGIYFIHSSTPTGAGTTLKFVKK